MTRKRGRALAAGVAAALAAGGCGGNEAQRTIRVAVDEPTCTIKPDGFLGLSAVSYGIGETLTRALPDGRGVKPWLVRSFRRRSPTRWEFTVRDGVRFHNGRRLDAVAVVEALRDAGRRTYTPDAVNSGRLRVTGRLSFTLTTRRPTFTPPHVLAEFHDYPIYDARAAKAAGDDERALVEAGIWTGPFEPVAVNRQRISARRFERYRSAVASPGLEVLCIPDGEARVAAVRGGEADIADRPPSEAREALAGADAAVYRRSRVANEAAYVQFNATRPPFDDREVRRAFALAIDYEQLVTQAASGVYEPARGLYPEAFRYAVATQRTDREEARRLLGDGEPLRIKLLYEGQNADHKSLGIALREQLAPAGFAVELVAVESTFDAKGFPEDWNALVMPLSMEGIGNDPTEVLGGFLGSGGQNLGRLRDPVLDRLVGDLSGALDPARREVLLRRVQRRIAGEAQAIVLGFKAKGAVVGARYRGYAPDPKLMLVTADVRPTG